MSLPKISAVITTYKKETLRLLDLLIGSAHKLNYPKELIDFTIVGPKRNKIEYEWENVKVLYPEPEDFTYAYAINYGVANTKSDMIWILNDDVIVTKNSLKNLVESFKGLDDKSLVVSATNTDNGVFFEGMFPIKHEGRNILFSDRFYKYEDWKEYVYSLQEAESPYPFLLASHPFICPVSMLMARKAFEEIGPFEEKLLMCGEELDYCMRAANLGYKFKIQMSSLVWHFGSSSSFDTTEEQRVVRAITFYEKWGFIPPQNPEVMVAAANKIKELGIVADIRL